MTTAAVAITGAHPYADKFPLLPESELVELARDIAANGLHNPIVVDRDGLILDGRNRCNACQRVNVEPTVTVYEGDDPAGFVIAQNVHRRHMSSTGARAMAAALVLRAAGRRKNGRWQRGSVDTCGSANSATWQSLMARAGVVLDHAPASVAEYVVHGLMSLDTAFKGAEATRNARVAEPGNDEAKAAYETALTAYLDQQQQADEQQRKADEKAAALEATSTAYLREHQRRERANRSLVKPPSPYVRIAQAIAIVGNYGRGVDPHVMDDFDPTDLNFPRALERYFELDMLECALRFIQSVIEWRNAYDALSEDDA